MWLMHGCFEQRPSAISRKVHSRGNEAGISQRCFHVGTGWDIAKSLPWTGRWRAGPLRWGSPDWARHGAPARRAGLQRGAPGRVTVAGRQHRQTGWFRGQRVRCSRGGMLENWESEILDKLIRLQNTSSPESQFPGAGEKVRPWARGRQLTMRSAGGCLAACAIFSDALLEASCKVRVDRCA